MYKTRAIIYKKKNKKLEIDEIKFTPPKDYEVVIKVKYSGLCGSVLVNLSRDPQNPELLGHEGTGIVLEVGKKVKHVKKKDHVLISWMPYGANEKTRYLNFTDFTYQNKKYSSLIYTLADKAKMHSQFVSKIPKNINLRDASIIGCAVISGYVPIINNKLLKKNSSLAIFGMGGLGLVALNAAKKIGIKNIVVIDIDSKKLKYARKFGAKKILNIKDKYFDKKILDFSNNKGYDFIFDCVGKKNIQEMSLGYLKKCIPGFRRGGNLGIIGFHYNKLELSAKDILMNENTIYGIRGGSTIMKRDLPKIYNDIKLKKLQLNKLISNTYDFKDINIAIKQLSLGNIIGRAVIKI